MLDVGNFAGNDESAARWQERNEMVIASEAKPAEAAASAHLRIDAAHGANPAVASPDSRNGQSLLEVIDEPAEAMVAAVLGESNDARREQLHLQVSQLAAHLRERLREVDRRESQLHARTAQVEAEARASRLWLAEREADFHERESELQRRIEALEEQLLGKLTVVSDSAPEPGGHCAERSQLEQQWNQREAELRERRQQCDRQALALRHAQQLWEQQQRQEQRELAEQRDELMREFQTLASERDEQLRAAEKALQQQAAALDADRQALLADRQAWDELKSRQRAALDDQRAGAESELADRRLRLDARQEWVERQKEGLEHVRSEILALHRQSLEMRLIAEQLWSDLSGRLPPAEVTRRIAQMRQKLAEQYKLEDQNLVARRQELLELGERISVQHGELTQLRSGLRDWIAARSAEIEGQAAALVQRELALDEQQEHFRSAELQWSAERRRYEQNIRELSGQLRLQPAAA
jgi:hypothetical protein